MEPFRKPYTVSVTNSGSTTSFEVTFSEEEKQLFLKSLVTEESITVGYNDGTLLLSGEFMRNSMFLIKEKKP